jgi:hypothetical protein
MPSRPRSRRLRQGCRNPPVIGWPAANRAFERCGSMLAIWDAHESRVTSPPLRSAWRRHSYRHRRADVGTDRGGDRPDNVVNRTDRLQSPRSLGHEVLHVGFPADAAAARARGPASRGVAGCGPGLAAVAQYEPGAGRLQRHGARRSQQGAAVRAAARHHRAVRPADALVLVDGVFHTHAQTFGFLDQTRLASRGITWSGSLGASYALGGGATFGIEMLYTPLRIRRPSDSAARTDALWTLRGLLRYRVH